MQPALRMTSALTELNADVQAIAPVDGFGIVDLSGGDRVLLHTRSPWGTAAYALPIADLPAPLRSSAPGTTQLFGLDAKLAATGAAELLTQHTVGRLVVAHLPDGSIFWTVSQAAERLSEQQLHALHAIGARALKGAEREETSDSAIARLRRLDVLDEIVPALASVLDVREVFERLAQIIERVIPYDGLGLAILSEDRRKARGYAVVGLKHVELPEVVTPPRHIQITADWLYFLIEDLQELSDEANMDAVKAGFRSSIRLPIRIREQLVGGLDIMSFQRGQYGEPDVSVAQRIADHVALALSHQRLAEQERERQTLEAHASKLELLDQLLASLNDTGELKDLFDRISSVARQVLPHDGLALPVLLPDGKHARRYANSGLNVDAIPEILEVPPSFIHDPDWEFDIIDDLTTRAEAYNQLIIKLGFISILRVPVRLEGKFAAVLSFMSRTPASYKQSDVQVARRIADRLALGLQRQRGMEETKRADSATARAAELEARVRHLTDELDARTGYRRVIGESPQWREVLKKAAQVAPMETTVLLLGESGTGKEVVARFVHRGSGRKDKPFVALNCAALPDHLLESELFGYERGAFTGAVQSKPGLIEQAAGGVLFLDEVGEMALGAQAKFLRVLQEREFQRLGGARVLKADVRVIAATNRDLQKAIEQKLFREDLYFRLNVFELRLPPLRERLDDILPLSEAFLHEIGRSIGRPPAGISRDAKQALSEYHWPGNVRELRNVLERAAILADGGLIVNDHLALRPLASRTLAPAPQETVLVSAQTRTAMDLKSAERAMIEKALADARFNKSVAAKQLGLSRAQLYARMKRHGLE